MYRDRIWCLFSKKLAGEASPDELTELEDLLRRDPDMHYALQNVTDIWQLSPKHIKEGDEAFLRHLERLKSTSNEWKEEKTADEIIPLPSRPSGRKILYLLASAIAIVFAGIFLYRTIHPTKPNSFSSVSPTSNKQNEISTGNGSTIQVTLPDGTSVKLNAGSTLNYDKSFSDGKREVTLSGEAYFDVAHDSVHPFIIHTAEADIQVLGTTFNVRAYPLEHRTETSLIRGSLEVRSRRSDEKRILKPEEKCIVIDDQLSESSTRSDISKNKPLMAVVKVNHFEELNNIIVETAWVKEKLIFDNESLKDIVATMERRYNVEIIVVDSSIQQLRFTGAFENQTIDQALEIISISSNGKIKYTIQGNKIVFTK